MIDSIQQYIDEDTKDFYNLVGQLAGALYASEIKDQELIENWYDFWMPLEIRRAVEGNEINQEKALKELQEMSDSQCRDRPPLRPLRSISITETSSLLRVVPPPCRTSILSLLWVFHFELLSYHCDDEFTRSI